MIDTETLAEAAFRMFEGWMSPAFQMQDLDTVITTLEDKAYEFYFLNVKGCQAAGVEPVDLVDYIKMSKGL